MQSTHNCLQYKQSGFRKALKSNFSVSELSGEVREPFKRTIAPSTWLKTEHLWTGILFRKKGLSGRKEAPPLRPDPYSLQQSHAQILVWFFKIFKLEDYGWWQLVTCSLHSIAHEFKESRFHTSSIWTRSMQSFSNVHATFWL